MNTNKEEREKTLLRRIDLKVNNGGTANEEDVRELLGLIKESSNCFSDIATAMLSLSEAEMKSGFITTEHKEEIAEKSCGDRNANWILSKDEQKENLNLARKIIFE